MSNHILSIILFTPLVGAFVLLLIPKENKNAIRWVANTFAVIGLLLAYKAYCKAERDCREPISEVLPPVYAAFLNKYWVDELNDYLITGRRKIGPVRLGAMGLGSALWKVDANFVDGGVNGAGWLTRFAGIVSSWWDKKIIDGLLVDGPALVAKALSWPVRVVQWGLVQWYALVMVGGLVGFIWYYAVR